MRQIVITALLLMTTLTISAQPPRPKDEANRGSKLHAMQCEQIITIMQMDDSTSSTFRKIYMEYNNAMAELRTPPPSKDRDAPKSEEEIERTTLESFDTSIKAMELRRDYYTKFRTILKPSEIATMYRTERKIRDRAIEELFQRDRR